MFSHFWTGPFKGSSVVGLGYGIYLTHNVVLSKQHWTSTTNVSVDLRDTLRAPSGMKNRLSFIFSGPFCHTLSTYTISSY